MKSIGFEKLNKNLKKLFHHLGLKIGENASYFITIPILICFLLATGLQQLNYINDPNYILTPSHGPAQTELKIVDQLFPLDYSHYFNPSRLHRHGRFAKLIITSKDKESLLRKEIWRGILQLDQLIKNQTIMDDEETFNFQDVCARWLDECYENEILELGEQMDEIEARNLNLTYPIMYTYAFPLVFGGIQLFNESTIASVKALQLAYFLNANSPLKDKRGALWEQKILTTLAEADSKWKLIKVDRFTGRTLSDQIDANILALIPYSIPTGIILFIFALVSCWMADCVRSKPWLGVAAMITSTLGTTAAFGFLAYCGVPFIGLNIAAPFLMLGIGMDDAFIVLAAWRQTSVHDPVPKRMADTYEHCAISITITSLTDMLSFFIGMASPFVSIQIFSVYTATSVFFTYIFHIFFLGGALALSGYHEAENRHSIFWWITATPKSKQNSSTLTSKLFFTGGLDPADPHNPVDNPEHYLMTFFRDKWASFLVVPWVKFSVLILFAAYIAISCWGISKTREGMDIKRLASRDSYLEKFYQTNENYFTEFSYRIQIVVSGDLEYSNQTIQGQIENLMIQLQQTKYTQGGDLYSESWLRSFLALADGSKENGFPFSIETESEFIQNLEQFYLGPSSVYSQDVKLNENKTKILAARFIIQTTNVTTTDDEREMVTNLRKIASAHSNLNVTVFHPVFLFADQFLLIRSSTIQLVAVAAIVMMGVSLIFIPNSLCSLWVALCIISIETGVLGFLALWNVTLDVLSNIYLVMSIGFSVDFSAHIAYAYLSGEGEGPQERLRRCMHSMGLPIIQGAVSTILGVIVLAVAPSYDYVVFFKAVFLVMIIATAHALLLLPVLLTLFGPGSFKKKESLSVVETSYRGNKQVF